MALAGLSPGWVGLAVSMLFLGIGLMAGCSDPVRDGRDPCRSRGGAPTDSTWGLFPMHHENPSWSHRGLIAYADRGIIWANSSGTYYVDPALVGIWIIDPRTREKRLLIDGDQPDWSPDGERLVYASDAVCTIHADGSGFTRLAPGHFPSWSPGGEWIAYDAANELGTYKVGLMRPDGTERHSIDGVATVGSRMPDWSPDARWIVHVRLPYRDGSVPREVYRMNPRGGDLTRLTQNLSYERDPTCSPDGSRIAFSAQPGLGDDPRPQIWVMDADGTCVRQVTVNGGSCPSWFPDGHWIVYTQEDWRANAPENGVLWMVNVETFETIQLTVKWPERQPMPQDDRLTVSRTRPAD